MEYFAFQWHITDACDQRCKHCYIFSEDAGREPDAMTWPQIQDTFYNCLDFCKIHRRLPYFYLTGGDPILHPSFWDLLGLMKENEIPFTILGNPFHLDDEVCRRLKEYGCEKYQLSLDGLRETHDWFRKPGSFDCTLEKISCIKKAGIRAVIMTTVSGANIDQIPALIDTVVAHRADVYAFTRYCPTSGEKDVGIEPLRYRQLLADCDRKFKAYEAAGCETYFNKKDHLWTLYEYETGEFHIPETAEPGVIYGGCNCGSCHLTILPTGDVYACRRVQNSRVGNVFTDRLADLWVCRMEEYRDFARFEKCAKCELLAWCRGCPAVASGRDGKGLSGGGQRAGWKFLRRRPPVLEGGGRSMNQVMQTILHRRSIRRFDPRQIDEGSLEQILQAGLYAPSAGGRQGPLFVVSQDREVNLPDQAGQLPPPHGRRRQLCLPGAAQHRR